MNRNRRSKPPPLTAEAAMHMTSDELRIERCSPDWQRACVVLAELERRERLRHDHMCAMVDRIISSVPRPSVQLLSQELGRRAI